MLKLEGRGAIVAGTRRIGRLVVERLAAEGVTPAILYRSSRAEAEALRDDVKALVPGACVIQADLAQEDDVVRAVDEARRRLPDLSACINLASDFPRTPLEALDAAAWDRGMATARAAYLLALHAGRKMIENPGPTRGHLVFFGDWAANETPYPDYLPYLTGKAAVHFLVRAFAVELAPHGILVNAISPGPTARPGDVTSTEWQKNLDRTPLQRESSAADIAEVIATLLKLETVTGENIRVDSGKHLAGIHG
jgi:NAD(P)-dependent dehydrogenase (short-subunit alcohol dehydrogenase family)